MRVSYFSFLEDDFLGCFLTFGVFTSFTPSRAGADATVGTDGVTTTGSGNLGSSNFKILSSLALIVLS